MSLLDEKIVATYFEENGFFVKPLVGSRSQTKKVTKVEGASLFVQNMQFIEGARDPAYLLFSSELRYLESALVCVEGWHGEKSALATMKDGNDVVRYLEANVLKKVDKWFALPEVDSLDLKRGPKKILIAPIFPAQEQFRRQVAAALRERGIDGILSFKSVLLDLIDRVDRKQVYFKNDVLQLIRTLKNFDLVKDPQMNFLG